MIYQIYKFHFHTALHVGEGNLTDGANSIYADTLFSALCHEALRMDGEKGIDYLVDMARQSKFLLSDMFPFVEDKLYIPKPLCAVKSEQDGDSIKKKQFKKLKFIQIKNLNTYLSGKLDPEKEIRLIHTLGNMEIRTMSSSRDAEKSISGDMLPFNVGVYKFHEGNGLYAIMVFENEKIKEKIESLLKALSYSGIGGKRSAGFGRFTFEREDIMPELLEKIKQSPKASITLSTSMAKPEELKKALPNSNYLLVRRGGFVSSTTYADALQRKRDFYAFKSGSYFENIFSGDVFDVSNEGKHPVYRYAKPLFMEV